MANVEVLANLAGLHGDGIIRCWGIIVGCIHDGQDVGVEAPAYKVEGFGFADSADVLQDFEAVKVRCDTHLPLGEVMNLV